jgi:ribosome-binding ATPase YchF (GTP1/OBG family)
LLFRCRARAAGNARMDGKDYVMRDGDVVEHRFQATSGHQN